MARPRLGVDGVRLGRGTALQLHRRRPEHLPDLERDPARRARRLRARLLPRLPDRSRRLHRRLLQQPGLGRRERLGLEVPDPAADSRVTAALVVLGGYLLGSMPFGYWLVLLAQGRGHPHRSAAATSARRTSGGRTGAGSGSRSSLLDVAKGFVPAFVGDAPRRSSWPACSRAAPRCSATGGRSSSASRRAARRSRPGAASFLGVAPLARAASGSSSGSSSSSSPATPRWRRSCAARRAAVRRASPRRAVADRRLRRDRGASACILLHRPNIARLRAGTESRFRLRRAKPARPASQSARVVCVPAACRRRAPPRSSPTVPSRSARTSCAWIVSKLIWRAKRKSLVGELRHRARARP